MHQFVQQCLKLFVPTLLILAVYVEINAYHDYDPGPDVSEKKRAIQSHAELPVTVGNGGGLFLVRPNKYILISLELVWYMYFSKSHFML